MYDDYINYYGFPRELGFIRVKRHVTLHTLQRSHLPNRMYMMCI